MTYAKSLLAVLAIGAGALWAAPANAAYTGIAGLGNALSKPAAEKVHWRPYRHCHWRHGYRRCHGWRAYRSGPGIHLYIGPGRRHHRWHHRHWH